MQQEERLLWKEAKWAGAKAHLELEKTMYMLADLQHMIQTIRENDPDLFRILALHRVWEELRNSRAQIVHTKELFNRLSEDLQQLEKRRSAIREDVTNKTYLWMPPYAAVADRETRAYGASTRHLMLSEHNVGLDRKG